RGGHRHVDRRIRRLAVRAPGRPGLRVAVRGRPWNEPRLPAHLPGSRGGAAVPGVPAPLPDRAARPEASQGTPGSVRVLGHDCMRHAGAAWLHLHVLRNALPREEDGDCRMNGSPLFRTSVVWGIAAMLIGGCATSGPIVGKGADPVRSALICGAGGAVAGAATGAGI